MTMMTVQLIKMVMMAVAKFRANLRLLFEASDSTSLEVCGPPRRCEQKSHFRGSLEFFSGNFLEKFSRETLERFIGFGRF